MGIYQRIKDELAQPLPGLDVQLALSPVRGEALKYYQIPENPKIAAVMCMLHSKGNQWHITYIERTVQAQDKHSGQISFPGGKMEDQDDSLASCAIRETQEELGIDGGSLEVVGSLSPLYVYASDFMVYPFVGILDFEPSYRSQKSEVARIIEMPLTYFMQKGRVQYTDLELRETTLRNVPYFDLEGKILWGATAMITKELIHIWERIY